MAQRHAEMFQSIPGCAVSAACDIVPEKVEAFAQKFSIPKAYADVDKMLAETDIDAVSIVTPDPAHAPVALKVIAQGKHVLCEKPLATNYADAQRMANAAQHAGVINMVNLSYRDSSAIQKAHELVKQGVIGNIRHVEASYLQGWLVPKPGSDWRTSPSMLWRLSTRHGSNGVLGDLGVHILDFASFAAGDICSINCHLKTFPKIEGDSIGEYVLDANDSAVITTEFTGGALGTVHLTRWAPGQQNSLRLRVYGDQGSLIVDLDDSWTTLKIYRAATADHQWETMDCGKTPTNYQRFITSIQTHTNDQPDFARGAQVQNWLDACLRSSQEGAAIEV